MSESGEYLRLNSVKECPICGGTLDKGYCMRYWSSERQLLDRVIPNSFKPGLWTADIVPAVECKNCGIAISDLRAPGYTPKSFLTKCVECKKDIPIASEECPYCGARQRRVVKP